LARNTRGCTCGKPNPGQQPHPPPFAVQPPAPEIAALVSGATIEHRRTPDKRLQSYADMEDLFGAFDALETPTKGASASASANANALNTPPLLPQSPIQSPPPGPPPPMTPKGRHLDREQFARQNPPNPLFIQVYVRNIFFFHSIPNSFLVFAFFFVAQEKKSSKIAFFFIAMKKNGFFFPIVKKNGFFFPIVKKNGFSFPIRNFSLKLNFKILKVVLEAAEAIEATI